MQNIAFISLIGDYDGLGSMALKLLKGRPLVTWILEEVQKLEFIHKIIIVTKEKGHIGVLSSYCGDNTNVELILNDDTRNLLSIEDHLFTYFSNNKCSNILLLNPVAPLITAEHLTEAFHQYEKNKYDSVSSCLEQREFLSEESSDSGAFYILSCEKFLLFKKRIFEKNGEFIISKREAYTVRDEVDLEISKILMKNRKKICNDIKLFVTDVDGVLTDAGMIYKDDGIEEKKFNTRDGKGIELLRNSGVKTAIITSENTDIVTRRAEKLKVDFLFQGARKKILHIEEMCHELGISKSEVAYIGDDINCLSAIQNVLFSACPNDAIPEVKREALYICDLKGGAGCVREFAEAVIENNNHFNASVSKD